MAFYELVFIARQEASSTEVDKIITDFTALVQSLNGTVAKQEYWGVRPLAYEIKNNKKGHYGLLQIAIDHVGLLEVRRKMTLREEVIRFGIVKVKKFDSQPSPVLKKSSDSEEVVDVTAK